MNVRAIWYLFFSFPVIALALRARAISRQHEKYTILHSQPCQGGHQYWKVLEILESTGNKNWYWKILEKQCFFIPSTGKYWIFDPSCRI